ncbi:MAG TPA: NADP-dependent oxidoreductase [Streptosporangiaceae bacterium]
MKAVRFDQYGDVDVLAYEDADTPVPGAGQVLVKVAATSFNPADVAFRAGYLSEIIPLTLPHIPGLDLAGTVESVGPGVTGWKTGDAVVAILPMADDGAAAEYVLAPADLLALAPTTVDLADAAALPASGLTAWQALFEHAGLTARQTILVNGAGGGVGGYAVQLARRAGATVTATASSRSADRLRGHGADTIIDYTVTPSPRPPTGSSTSCSTWSPTRPRTPPPWSAWSPTAGSTSAPPPRRPAIPPATCAPPRWRSAATAQLAELVALVDGSGLTIDVAARRPLSELAEVHRLAERGALPGKIVITP